MDDEIHVHEKYITGIDCKPITSPNRRKTSLPTRTVLSTPDSVNIKMMLGFE